MACLPKKHSKREIVPLTVVPWVFKVHMLFAFFAYSISLRSNRNAARVAFQEGGRSVDGKNSGV